MAWCAGPAPAPRSQAPTATKSSPVAKLPGVKAGDYGICMFSSRASLETALLDLAKQNWKAGLVYKYE